MTTAEDFRLWFARNLTDIRFFSADEFLTKGVQHARNGLNTDPPEALWPNVIPLARLLDALRSRLNKPITFNSVYRSPAYNKAISGAGQSLHMEFKAADFIVQGLGGPADWAATLRAMRASGLFKGAIGTYDGFVHVDVRGENVDFDNRGGPKEAGRVLGSAASGPAPPPKPAPVTIQPPKPPTAPSPRLSFWQWLGQMFSSLKGA